MACFHKVFGTIKISSHHRLDLRLVASFRPPSSYSIHLCHFFFVLTQVKSFVSFSYCHFCSFTNSVPLIFSGKQLPPGHFKPMNHDKFQHAQTFRTSPSLVCIPGTLPHPILGIPASRGGGTVNLKGINEVCSSLFREFKQKAKTFERPNIGFRQNIGITNDG
ncbi:25299_t:CDS:2 [Gigaspora rosea]|nr:25299_t:CDS:2 [Gigaspora rosea]